MRLSERELPIHLGLKQDRLVGMPSSLRVPGETLLLGGGESVVWLLLCDVVRVLERAQQ